MNKWLKRLGVLLLVLVVAGILLRQYRLDLLLWALPTINKIRTPVAENQPVSWPKGPEVAKQSPAERPPNIIIFVADDLGFNDISLYNGGAADGSLKTPAIDAVGQQGVIFNNGYSASATCAPSRAALMTGRYPTRFGFEFTPFFKTGSKVMTWMNKDNPPPIPTFIDDEAAAALPPITDLGVPPEEITIAEVLKDKGYYTAHVGKWHIGSNSGMRPEQQGFDDSLYMKGILYDKPDSPDVVNALVEGDFIDNMMWAMGSHAVQWNGSEPFAPNDYLTDYFTDAAVEVIENNRNRPFFMYLAHWGPHSPLQAAKADYDALSHIKDHRLRVYAAMIRAVDRSMAKIEETLAKNGLSDNTLILFTSDNGGAGYIGLPNINKPYRGWKLTQFEGGTHVPFMAKWPAKIPAGTTVDSAVHQFDLFTTVAAAGEATIPTDRKIDGVDLLPHVLNETSEPPHKTLFWRHGHQQSVRHEGWKLIRAQQSDKPEAKEPLRFLFHLTEDPTEQTNLAGEMPEKVAELEAFLAAHNAEQAESMWQSPMDVPVMIDKSGDLREKYEEGDVYLYYPN